MTGRVLLIGLDSADAELIERWADQGHLPAFDRLRREGLWTRLGTTAEVMHVSAWPSIYTGVTPGQHGLYHAYQVRAGDQRIQRTQPSWGASRRSGSISTMPGAAASSSTPSWTGHCPASKGSRSLEYGTWTWFGEPARHRRPAHRTSCASSAPIPPRTTAG